MSDNSSITALIELEQEARARVEELETAIREACQILAYGIANGIGEGLIREAAAALSVLNEATDGSSDAPTS